MRRSLFPVLILSMTSLAAFAQAPAVLTDGCVDGASFRPAQANGALTPGGIASCFGTNLASAVAVATAVPLSPTLGNQVSLIIDGQTAPLFFVSAGQINFQVPWGVAPGIRPLQVRNSNGQSQAINVLIAAARPSIFSQTSNGRGLAVIQNFVASGNVLNTFATAARSGQVMVAYVTSLGAVQQAPASGAAGNGQQTQNPVTAAVGGRAATVQFAGLVPGFVGLYQVNFVVPAGTPDSCYVPVQITVSGQTSNTTTIAVAASGNCLTANNSVAGTSVGVATLLRMAIQIPGLPPIPGISLGNLGIFAANFTRAPAGGSVGAVYPVAGSCIVDVYRSDNASSEVPGTVAGTSLNAGALTLTGPGFSQTVNREASGSYVIAPSATNTSGINITAGQWTLRGAGGPDVGAFTANLTVAGTLQNANLGASSTTFQRNSNLNMSWTCPDSSAQMQILVASADSDRKLYGYVLCSVACSAGQYQVPAALLQQLPASSSMGAQIQLLMLPNFNTYPRFTATGIDFGYFIYGDGAIAVGLTLQ